MMKIRCDDQRILLAMDGQARCSSKIVSTALLASLSTVDAKQHRLLSSQVQWETPDASSHGCPASHHTRLCSIWSGARQLVCPLVLCRFSCLADLGSQTSSSVVVKVNLFGRRRVAGEHAASTDAAWHGSCMPPAATARAQRPQPHRRHRPHTVEK